jgi:hypothetical protein
MDNDPRTANIIDRSNLVPTFVRHPLEPRATGVRDDGPWRFVLVLLAAPVAVAGGLSWLLATWAGSWLAPAAAALLLVPVTTLTVWAKRARSWMLLLTASFAAAGMINWFGGTAPVDFRHSFDETSQVAAERIPSVSQDPGLSHAQPTSRPRTMS